VLYLAANERPCPTAILLHGIPGTEKNVDIAYRLRDLGWHTLILNFRGAWGSDGNYDMTTQPDDAIAAIDYLVNSAWNVDAQRIALIGYSLGSRVALVAAHRDTRVGAVVSISGIADFDEIMLSNEFYTNASPLLRNATPQALNQQWMKLGGAENPCSIIGALQQPTLIVHGTADELIPYWMASGLYDASGQKAVLQSLEGADHTFTQHRAQLVDTVTSWLQNWIG
jgi:uncharacterized protein